MDIIVIRGQGDLRGQDITDPLLHDTLAGIARGRMAIDSASNKAEEVLDVYLRSGIRLGEIVEVHDSLYGVSWRGKVSGVTHTISADTGGVPTTTLRIERPV